MFCSTSPTAGTQDWGDNVYVANADGRDVAGPILQRDAPGVTIHSLAWSPDGTALIYGYFRAVYGSNSQVTSLIFQIRRVGLTDGSVTLLLDNASQPSLSWDGKEIVYITYPSSDLNVTDLAMAGIDGSNPHTILTSQTGFQSYFAPHLSPDGKRLVFAAIGGPVGRAPQERTAATHAPSPTIAGRVMRLVSGWLEPATAQADGSPYEVWVVNLDGSGLHPVANLREDLPFPLWSADGRQILFLGAAALYLAEADGSGVNAIDRGIVHWASSTGTRGHRANRGQATGDRGEMKHAWASDAWGCCRSRYALRRKPESCYLGAGRPWCAISWDAPVACSRDGSSTTVRRRSRRAQAAPDVCPQALAGTGAQFALTQDSIAL